MSGIADRLESLRAAGLPSTVYGRILCQKNLLFGKAVFFILNQLPSNLGGMLRDWQSQFADLLWSTTSGDHRAAAGEQRGAAANGNLVFTAKKKTEWQRGGGYRNSRTAAASGC